MKSIALLTNSISIASGGVPYAMNTLYNKDVRSTFDIKLFSYKDSDQESDFVLFEDFEKQLFPVHFFLYSNELIRALSSQENSILHLHGLWRFPHVYINLWKAKTSQTVVCSPHGMLDSYILGVHSKLKKIAYTLLGFNSALNKVDVFHALCLKEYEDIRNFNLKQPIAIIPNGIDPLDIQVDKDFPRNKRLLYLARIHDKKGYLLLIEAFADLVKKNRNQGWKLDIVGNGDKDTIEELRLAIECLEMDEYIVYHGPKFGQDKEKMYLSASAFILPSHGEGLPMSVLEAWKYSLPTVLTPYCNFPDSFEAGAAIQIEPEVHSIQQGLLKLFSMSDSDLKEKGKIGNSLFLNNYTTSHCASKMIELYKWLDNRDEPMPDFVYFD